MEFVKRKRLPPKIFVMKYGDFEIEQEVYRSALFWANSTDENEINKYIDKIKAKFIPVKIYREDDIFIKFVDKKYQKKIEYKLCKFGTSLFNEKKPKLRVIGIKTKNATVYPNIL